MNSNSHPRLRAVSLAVAGLLLAGGLGAATAQLTSQQVGLSGEPASIGSELIADPQPRDRSGPSRAERRRKAAARARRAKQRAEAAAAPEPAPPASEPAEAPAASAPAAPAAPAPPTGQEEEGEESGEGPEDDD